MKHIESIVIEGKQHPQKYEQIFEDKRGKRHSVIINVSHPPLQSDLINLLNYAETLYDKYFSQYSNNQKSNSDNSKG